MYLRFSYKESKDQLNVTHDFNLLKNNTIIKIANIKLYFSVEIEVRFNDTLDEVLSEDML